MTVMQKSIIISCLVLCVIGCNKPNYQSQQQANATLQNAGDYINNNFDYTLFAAALKKTGFLDTLNNPNASFTVFVPTNEAFNADSILSPSDFDKIPIDTLRTMMRSYILRQKLFFSDIPANMDNLYPNLNGVNLYLSAFSTSSGYTSFFLVDGVRVTGFTNAAGNATTYDVPQANAVIHVLPTVMKSNAYTVQDFLTARPDLSDFVAACKHFNLWDGLKTANPATVYAVNNAGMEGRGLTADSIARLDTSQYYPALFSGYVEYPHHLFVWDLTVISAFANATGVSYNSNAIFPLAGGYSFIMTGTYGGFGCYMIDLAGNYIGPIPSPYGYPETTPYVPGETDFTCSNGVVHILSDLVVLPSAVHK